ncbi:hypothetical protein GOBAR_AA16428 [Gossypium barbadense]|uniref:RNase H type-1 domain-containing protein n=1 Tax=Gossypium barbadense TaxID=3634 RepID=A0A2P5XLP6_GOSBA|nr:hypothetical protein GOBAR_AA16428 [Gossypium barbadense]
MHEGVKDNVQDIVVFIKPYLTDLTQLEDTKDIRSTTVKETWVPLEEGIVKVNFDASYHKQSKKGIRGVVLKNSKGLVMGASVYQWENVRDPTTTEAWARL